jgi:hypothetical protein
LFSFLLLLALHFQLVAGALVWPASLLFLVAAILHAVVYIRRCHNYDRG